jgi:hypothetical protein
MNYEWSYPIKRDAFDKIIPYIDAVNETGVDGITEPSLLEEDRCVVTEFYECEIGDIPVKVE